MCGILFTNYQGGAVNADQLKPRGPDSTTSKSFTYGAMNITMVFHRLSITGVHDGDQPFFKDGVYVMCNGEIYNYKELEKKYDIHGHTKSDCEIILGLYLAGGKSVSLLSELNGEFAFIIFDSQSGNVFFGRDTYGVRPLYIGIEKKGYIVLSSELKGLPCPGEQVCPGAFFCYNVFTNLIQMVVNNRVTFTGESVPEEGELVEILTKAVRDRLPEEVECGFLLSGGFDSSIILSIASRIIPIQKKIQVFSIGFSEDAPDVVNAKRLINYLTERYKRKYHHHVIIKSIKEGIDAIPEVIRVTETFDTTTIRASTPMYLLAKYISDETDVKVLLSGEGSDEANGSYLYFLYQKDLGELAREKESLLNNIYMYDGLRADRTVSGCGLELRVPFLDPSVVNFLLNCGNAISTATIESRVEKQYIREAFRDDYLPDEILWRSKAAFSDAVSYSWRDAILKKAQELNYKLCPTPKHLPPKTAEDRWYRYIFDAFYEECATSIPYYWRPKWVDAGEDPSATVLSVHAERQKDA